MLSWWTISRGEIRLFQDGCKLWGISSSSSKSLWLNKTNSCLSQRNTWACFLDKCQRNILGAYARWSVGITLYEYVGETRSYGLVSEILELVLLEKNMKKFVLDPFYWWSGRTSLKKTRVKATLSAGPHKKQWKINI